MMILFIVAVAVCATTATYLSISMRHLKAPHWKSHKITQFINTALMLIAFAAAIYSWQHLSMTKKIIGIVIGLSISTAILIISTFLQSRKDSENE